MPHRTLLHLSLLMVLSALALAPPVYPQVRFVPPAPVATEAVRAEMTYATNCFFRSDLQLPPGGTGTIKIFAVEGCICPASPLAPYTFSVDLGTLAPGLYPVEVYLTREINTIPCEFEPQLLGRTWLTVAGRDTGRQKFRTRVFGGSETQPPRPRTLAGGLARSADSRPEP